MRRDIMWYTRHEYRLLVKSLCFLRLLDILQVFLPHNMSLIRIIVLQVQCANVASLSHFDTSLVLKQNLSVSVDGFQKVFRLDKAICIASAENHAVLGFIKHQVISSRPCKVHEYKYLRVFPQAANKVQTFGKVNVVSSHTGKSVSLNFSKRVQVRSMHYLERRLG